MFGVPLIPAFLLLGVQTGLIRRQVIQMKSFMGADILVHGHALMPTSPIHIEPDRICPQASREMSQDFQESLSVAPFCSNHAMPTQKRRHPARNIETMLMLAGRRDAKALSFLGPNPPQPRMQAESRLILEDHGLPRTQILKFFLRRGETAWLPPFWLGGTYIRRVSSDTRADASSSVLAEPSASSQTVSSSGRLESARPNSPGLVQTPGVIAPDLFRLAEISEALNGSDVPAVACFSTPPAREHLPPGPNGSGSFASNPKLRPSTPVSGPR